MFKDIALKTSVTANRLEVRMGESISIQTSREEQEQILERLQSREKRTDYQEIQIDFPGNQSLNLSDIGFYFLALDSYPRLTVQEQLKFFKQLYQSDNSIEELLERLHLTERARTKGKELTYSEQKRLVLGRLLLQNPRVFVMEEPIQNVDWQTKQLILRFVQEVEQEGKSIVLLTESLENAMLLSRSVYQWRNGKLQFVESEITVEPEEETAVPTDLSPGQQMLQKIATKVDKNIVLLDIAELDYLESIAGTVQVNINYNQYPGLYTLQEYEQRLQAYPFFRCHRSYLVNLEKVAEVMMWTRNSYSLLLKNGKEVPLSKNRVALLKEILGLQ